MDFTSGNRHGGHRAVVCGKIAYSTARNHLPNAVEEVKQRALERLEEFSLFYCGGPEARFCPRK